MKGALPSWNLQSNSNSLLTLLRMEIQRNLYTQGEKAYTFIRQNVVVKEKESS